MRFGLLIASLTLIAAGPVSAASICDGTAGNAVANCGFETGSFTNWTLGGNVDPFTFVDPGYANSGNFGLASGATGAPVFLSQAVTTAPGAYHLSFYLFNTGGGVPNSFVASWNGAPVFTMSDAGGMSYSPFSFAVTAVGASSTIEFDFQDDPGLWGLDDVVLTADTPSEVPEPGTLALMFGGLLPVLAVARRRRS